LFFLLARRRVCNVAGLMLLFCRIKSEQTLVRINVVTIREKSRIDDTQTSGIIKSTSRNVKS